MKIYAKGISKENLAINVSSCAKETIKLKWLVSNEGIFEENKGEISKILIYDRNIDRIMIANEECIIDRSEIKKKTCLKLPVKYSEIAYEIERFKVTSEIMLCVVNSTTVFFEINVNDTLTIEAIKGLVSPYLELCTN